MRVAAAFAQSGQVDATRMLNPAAIPGSRGPRFSLALSGPCTLRALSPRLRGVYSPSIVMPHDRQARPWAIDARAHGSKALFTRSLAQEPEGAARFTTWPGREKCFSSARAHRAQGCPRHAPCATRLRHSTRVRYNSGRCGRCAVDGALSLLLQPDDCLGSPGCLGAACWGPFC
jgi:hypothetical protein